MKRTFKNKLTVDKAKKILMESEIYWYCFTDLYNLLNNKKDLTNIQIESIKTIIDYIQGRI